MRSKKKSPFDPAPYKKAILEIQSVERKIVKEIRKEAERQDRKKESLNPPYDAS